MRIFWVEQTVSGWTDRVPREATRGKEGRKLREGGRVPITFPQAHEKQNKFVFGAFPSLSSF